MQTLTRQKHEFLATTGEGNMSRSRLHQVMYKRSKKFKNFYKELSDDWETKAERLQARRWKIVRQQHDDDWGMRKF